MKYYCILHGAGGEEEGGGVIEGSIDRSITLESGAKGRREGRGEVEDILVAQVEGIFV